MSDPHHSSSDSICYEYTRLDSSRRQIRIAQLLPGKFEDDIRVQLHTISLTSPPPPTPHISLSDLKKTLPKDWLVHETLYGRFLFQHDREYAATEGSDIRWTHPIAGVEPIPNNYDYPFAKPEYEALSHVWGLEAAQTVILVEDPLPNSLDSTTNEVRSLTIRTELATALRHIRKANASRMMWVDNICINQDDTTERNHQVSQMGDIYRLARRVVIWLGPTRDNSSLAILNSPGCQEPNWSRTMVPLPYDTATWDAIQNLLQRAWLGRVWVYQEAKLGNSHSIIQCGFDQVPLYVFAGGIWCAVSKTPTTSLQALLISAGETVLPLFNKPFLNTLLHLNHKDCFDPRDKVYGALGLAPPQIASMIVPGYNKSVSDVYRDTCVALISVTDRVDFLLTCDLATKKLAGPSWVPEWSTPPKPPPRSLISTMQACGVSGSCAESLDELSPVLVVRGVEFGTVRTVGISASAENLSSTLRTWAGGFAEDEEYVTGGNILEAFVRTIHWNMLRERFHNEYGLPTLAGARESVLQTLLAGSNFICGDGEKKPSSILTGSAYCPEILGRSFITTDTGYMGLTSAIACVDDKVCIVLGCASPLILRPDQSGGFYVVGTAYVQGVMDAEVLMGPLDSDWIFEVGAHHSNQGYARFSFRNQSTGEVVDEDPRLGGIPPDWVPLQAPRTSADPLQFVRYQHMVTGRTINGDPRLLPEALLARGVALKTLRLI